MASSPRRAFAATPAGPIHYRELGAGPPLVLLHEVARSSDGFSEVLPCLAARFRCLAMDLPGYGDSYHPADYPGMPGYARAVVDFFDAVGLARTHLLGFHTGAAVAAEVAAAFPDRVDKLVLCGLPDVAEEERERKLAALRPTFPDPEFRYLNELAAGLASYASRYWGTDYGHRYGIDFLKAMPNTHWGHRAVYEQRIRERIPLIAAPTLLFCSRDDAFAHVQPELARLFRTVRTAVIEESEKFPLVTQPAASCALITAFLLE
ncbi:MAG: alpha/beta hydrolase [Chloroflexota bacterium]|nr:alpha/beta hydrolase [Dehalococcoidia bacterium]MDW8254888.1 alpha/beta hydrolase [Chloroflexota bacterium]